MTLPRSCSQRHPEVLFLSGEQPPGKGWQGDMCRLSRGRSRPRGHVRAVSPGVGWSLPSPGSGGRAPAHSFPWLAPHGCEVSTCGSRYQVLGKANGASEGEERLNCQVLFWGEKTCKILVGVVARRPVAFSFSNHQNP